MYPIPFMLFQLYGILPFKVTSNKIYFSKFWFIWTILITSTFIVLSINRCSAYLDWRFEISNNYIYMTLLKYEPFWVLLGVCMSTTPFYFSINRLQKYVQNLLRLSLALKNTNKKRVAVVMLTIVEWFVLYEGVQIFYPTSETIEAKIDSIVSILQSTIRSAHLLHLYVAISVLVGHLKIIETSMESWNLKKIFVEYCKLLKVYKQLRRLYQTFLRFILLEVFYDVMTGLKVLEDISVHHQIAEKTVGHEAFTIFWYLLHTPLLMLILHEGQLFNQKVLYQYF